MSKLMRDAKVTRVVPDSKYPTIVHVHVEGMSTGYHRIMAGGAIRSYARRNGWKHASLLNSGGMSTADKVVSVFTYVGG